jgi:O-antigen/teichoic acid export membrane protein
MVGGIWAFGGRIAAAILGLAVHFLVTRLLTPNEAGDFFLTISIVGFSTILAGMGFQQASVRLIAEAMGNGRSGKARAVVNTMFRWGGLGAVVIAILIIFGGRQMTQLLFQSETVGNVMYLAGFLVFVRTLQVLLAETFRGFHDIRLAVVFGGVIASTLSVIMLGILWFSQGKSELRFVLLLLVVAGSAGVIIASFTLRTRLLALEQPEAIGSKELLNIAWPLLITNITIYCLTQAGLWIVGAFRPSSDVALYGASARLVQLVAMPLLIVNAVVPPFIAELYSQGRKKELEKALRTTATLAGLPAFIVLIAFFFVGRSILELSFGEFYGNGTTILCLLSIGHVVNVWAGSCGLTLMLTGHQRTMMMITLLCCCISIIMGLILVSPYGAEGVAFASATGLVMQNILMWTWAKKRTGVWTHMGGFRSWRPLALIVNIP